MQTADRVNLSLRHNKPAVTLSTFTQSSLWSLEHVSGLSYFYRSSSHHSARLPMENGRLPSHVNNFTRVVFWIEIKRKVTYYKLNVLYPVFLLTTMQLLTFLLPLNSLIRVPQATTILLSILIFQAVVVDELPKTSDSISLISAYTMMMMAISAAAIAESVFVANLVRRHFGPVKMTKAMAFILRPILVKPVDIPSPGSSSLFDSSISEAKTASRTSLKASPNMSNRQFGRRLGILSEESISSHGASVRSNEEQETYLCNASSFEYPDRISLNPSLATQQVARIQNHLTNVWRTAAGKRPLVDVTIDWPLIAMAFNVVVRK